MSGMQICIANANGERAATIIRGMRHLLEMRYEHRVSRREFMKRWHTLRLALRLTDEYAALRRNVELRGGGKCEVCGTAEMVHVHHKRRVSWFPESALDLENCVGVCEKCHKAEDSRWSQELTHAH